MRLHAHHHMRTAAGAAAAPRAARGCPRPGAAAPPARPLSSLARGALGAAAADAAAAPADAGAGAVSEPRARREFKPRVSVRELLRTDAGAPAAVGGSVELRGWVRTVRNQKQFAFMQVNDGSNLSGIQVVLEPQTPGFDLVTSGAIATGAAVKVNGSLTASPGAKQAVEVKAASVELVGGCDAEAYPLQKKRHSLEFLRSIAHLRPRTNTIGAVARVTTLLSGLEGPAAAQNGAPKAGELETTRQQVSNQGAAVKAAKEAAKAAAGDAGAAAAKRAAAEEAVAQLLALKEKLAAMEAAAGAGQLPRRSDGAVDYGRDFFGEKTFLTVSGQLNGEMYACAMGDIYTFGPTFRAENSNTARHLAEFWMIEPEIAFADLEDDMACAEAYLKHCTRHILKHCEEDLAFFESMDVVNKPFATVTYTEAVRLLIASGHKFDYPVSWGLDLQSEHERFLSETVFNRTPLFVTDYPRDIKAFYMRQNGDGRTVAAMDLLVPRVGELIGGSQREERLDVLSDRMRACGLEPDDYSSYLDLRRYGSVPHAGFGLGFERLVQFSTGVENIRDVIPFPRWPGHCKF
ncbi:asparaginyl-tRNA synthetase [Raphidocelis subcapitata]|uniref:asparagine--tRNA ligase n=1 Tax=Raphidocelis subcapitata TaxID=307507 RepID=A0A2V0NVJ4_9CHLO|nr:asparaginyl-tRNA synthetase [Raphidocelis subcapitata]|eukprot:GBF89590.1 asparaginyl-tRNA synthetase [Raphidocelis subcapitata]